MSKQLPSSHHYSPAILLPILAAVLAIFPLLPAGIPSTADGPLHLIRGVEFDAVLRSGVLYPRWAPDLAFGYGYPLFNFYAPLFYYLTEIPHLLGASFELALKLTIFLAFLLYGLGAYWWTRPFLGKAPAAVAGVAYIYVPFRFHEAYMQGDYPQFFALALAPFALGAVYQLFAANRPAFRHVAVLTLSLAAILLTHNISALWLAPTLAGYAIILGYRKFRRLVLAAGIGLLSLGLTAFFWLPALAEQSLVQLYRLRTDDYDVRHSFISLATLLAPPGVVDQAAANPPPFLHLGWGQVALALATIPLLILAMRAVSRIRLPGASIGSHLLFGWLLLLASAAMTLSFSLPVWRRIPLLAYTQFPWRVLELSGIATALLAGLAVHLALTFIGGRRSSAWVVGVALVVLVVPSLVYLYPRRPFLTYGHMAGSDVTAYERNGGAVGTTSTGEYYPLDVHDRPTAPLPKNLSQIGRLNRTTLPANARVSLLSSAGYGERYAITLAQPTTLRFDLIRFAGWQVAIDGQTVTTRASVGQGLLLVDATAGSHQLDLNFVDTPVRRLGWILALLSALGLAGLGLASAGFVPRWSKQAGPVKTPPEPDLALSRRGVVALGGGFVSLIALRVTSPAPYAAIFARQSPLDRVIGVRYPAKIRLADKVEFLGYDLERDTVRPGAKLAVTLYWRALQPLVADYRCLAMIARVGDKGLVAQDDQVNPGGVPTHTWPTDRYFIDQQQIAVPTDVPPMVYQLQVALYDPKTSKHLQQDGVSGWQGEQIVLRQIHVTRPSPVDPSTYHSIEDPVFGEQITLIGYRVDPDRPRAGQDLRLTLIWRAKAPLDHDYTVFTHLVDANQKQVAGNDSMPLNGQYPTSDWLPGEDVVDPHPIALPTTLAAGHYHLAFGLYDAKTLERLNATRKDWSAPHSQIDLDELPILVTTGG